MRRLPTLAQEIRENLNSGDAYMNFLSGRPKEPDIPPRCGYYIGMLIARELRRKHTLPELARLGGEPLRREMETALFKLESKNGKSANRARGSATLEGQPMTMPAATNY
jgi:hypothetical protein